MLSFSPLLESPNFDNLFSPRHSLKASLLTFFTKPLSRYQLIHQALDTALGNQEFSLCYQQECRLNNCT